METHELVVVEEHGHLRRASSSSTSHDPTLRLQRRNVLAEAPLDVEGEEAAAAFSYGAALTCRSELVLPIGYRLPAVTPDGAGHRAELVVVNGDIHAAVGEVVGRRFQ